MRKLTDIEREYVKKTLEANAKSITIVMNFFKIFGVLQMVLLVLYAVFGKSEKSNVPFVIVACVILYLVYFKFTGFLANANQWKRLLKVLNNKTEFVYECDLLEAKKVGSGRYSSRKLIAHVLLEGRDIKCYAAHELKDVKRGSTVILVCMQQDFEKDFRYAVPMVRR